MNVEAIRTDMDDTFQSKSLKLVAIFTLVMIFGGCAFLERNTLGVFRDLTSSPAPSEEAQLGSARALEEAGQVVAAVNTSASDPLRPKTTSVEIEKLDTQKGHTGSVEIVWEIPKEPVDAFIIRYGYSRDKLEFTVRVEASQVEKFEDPKHGMVYRHLMDEVPAEKAVFIAMASVKGQTTSELSKVFEVKPADL